MSKDFFWAQRSTQPIFPRLREFTDVWFNIEFYKFHHVLFCIFLHPTPIKTTFISYCRPSPFVLRLERAVLRVLREVTPSEKFPIWSYILIQTPFSLSYRFHILYVTSRRGPYLLMSHVSKDEDDDDDDEDDRPRRRNKLYGKGARSNICVLWTSWWKSHFKNKF